MAIAGSYKKQPVQHVGKEYSGELIRGILTEVDYELRRRQAVLDSISGTGTAPGDASYITIAAEADLISERRLAVGSTRLSLTDAGANSTVTLDAVMSSTDWDWTRGLSVFGSVDEVQLDLKGHSTQTNPVLRVLQQADGVRTFQVDGSGTVTAGDTTHTDSIVRFQVRAPSTQATNILQVVRAFAGGNYTAWSMGQTGANVFGDTGTDGIGVTRLQIRQGTGQTADLANVLNSSSVSIITINSAGQLQFTATAGSTPFRVVGGSPATSPRTFLGAANTSGDVQWQTIGAADIPHDILSATHSDTLAASVVLGDIIHGNTTPKWARLAGNTTATKQFLTQTGTGAVSAVPVWGTIAASDLPGSFSGFANPTASVGLSAVNGTATTAMRSDGAPALSQAIAPTWTGLHTFNPGTTPTDAIFLDIAALGGAGTRSSHNVVWRGRANDGSAHNADWKMFVDVNLNTALESQLKFQTRVDASAFFTRFELAGTGHAQLFAIYDDSANTACAFTTGSFFTVGQIEIAKTIGLPTSVTISTSGISSSRAHALADAGGTTLVWTAGTDGFQPAAGTLLYGAGTTTALSGLTIGASGTVLTSTGSAPQWSTNAAVVDIARTWSTLQKFPDNTFQIIGSATASKILAIEVDGLTAATTRTWTAQDLDLTVAGINVAQTFTALQTFRNNTIKVVDSSDATKTLVFSLSGASTGADLTLAWAGTADRTVTIPHHATNFTLASRRDNTFLLGQTIQSDAAGGSAQLTLTDTTGGFSSAISTAPTANRTLTAPDASGALAVTAGARMIDQNASIGSTALVTSPVAGNYVISYTLECSTADITAGAVTITFGWTDRAGAATKVTSSRVLTATGRLTDNTTFSVNPSSGDITYLTTLTGSAGTAKYDFSISVVQVPL